MSRIKHTYRRCYKRPLDILLSVLGLIGVAPLLLAIIIASYVSNRGSVFFLQERIGYRGKKFKIIKVKTMRDAHDSNGKLLDDEQRLTIVGKFLRLTSLDEIFQIFNVLKGEMSLVGPRPMLSKYMSPTNKFQPRRLELRPGITGWAQVNGRNTITYPERFKLDVEYLDNLTFVLDVRIIIMTIKQLFKFSEAAIERSENFVDFKSAPAFEKKKLLKCIHLIDTL